MKGKHILAPQQIVDLVGQRFGPLLVLGIARRCSLLVRCTCGTEKVMTPSTLARRGSCGCQKHVRSHREWSRQDRLFEQYRTTAKRNCREWSISLAEFTAFVTASCHYCGTEPGILLNGIDRKDNSQGYTLQNSLTCCRICNYAKRDSSYADFLAWIRKAARHLEHP